MSTHANGLEIIEVGATAWRIIINDNFDKTLSNQDLNNYIYSFNDTYLNNINGNATVTINGTEKKLDYLITLGANITIANPSPMFPVGKKGTILLKQDSTGNRTVTWGSAFKFPNGTAPTLSTTAGYVDAIEYICTDSNTIICNNVTIGIH